MVLRFMTDEPAPRHLAFSSERKTWTDKPPAPISKYDAYHPIIISAEAYAKIEQEIDFNGYGYSEDLYAAQSIPLF